MQLTYASDHSGHPLKGQGKSPHRLQQKMRQLCVCVGNRTVAQRNCIAYIVVWPCDSPLRSRGHLRGDQSPRVAGRQRSWCGGLLACLPQNSERPYARYRHLFQLHRWRLSLDCAA